ncbi:hypothetical protein [Marinobacter salicampi]|nr:hypothetical protein [Marinobacter salicampi]
MKKIIIIAVIAVTVQMSFAFNDSADNAAEIAANSACELRYENNVDLMCP